MVCLLASPHPTRPCESLHAHNRSHLHVMHGPADEFKKRVVIVDTSNEIGGDGDVPHPAIGSARRMQVPDPSQQHKIMVRRASRGRGRGAAGGRHGHGQRLYCGHCRCRSASWKHVKNLLTCCCHPMEWVSGCPRFLTPPFSLSCPQPVPLPVHQDRGCRGGYFACHKQLTAVQDRMQRPESPSVCAIRARAARPAIRHAQMYILY